MKKVIFLLLFLHSFLFSCEICVLTSPKTEVLISVISNKTHIEKINFTWIVSKEFTLSLNEIYDQNTNSILDKDEIENIYTAFISYVKPKNYLTKIDYYKDEKIETIQGNKILEDSVFIKNDRLHLTYSIEYKKEIKDLYNLEIEVFDENRYFDLKINNEYSHFNNFQKETDLSGIIFTISKDNIIIPKKENIIIEDIQIEESYLKTYSLKIKEYLQKIKKGEDKFALIFLLFISFIYGMIHAIGPGHGKSLAFSYFLINKTSVSKAFLISFATAFIHILGAFILVLVSVFILESFLNSFVNDSVYILTKVSAVLIVILALFILYNKLYKKSCICSSCEIPEKENLKTNDFKNMTWSNSHTEKSIENKKTKNKQDLYFVLTAGLIPCPGTVILFIYAFVLKTYFAVILASIFISLGMGFVIFSCAFLGLGFKKLSHKSHKISKILEYFAIFIMLGLGIILFFSF